MTISGGMPRRAGAIWVSNSAMSDVLSVVTGGCISMREPQSQREELHRREPLVEAPRGAGPLDQVRPAWFHRCRKWTREPAEHLGDAAPSARGSATGIPRSHASTLVPATVTDTRCCSEQGRAERGRTRGTAWWRRRRWTTEAGRPAGGRLGEVRHIDDDGRKSRADLRARGVRSRPRLLPRPGEGVELEGPRGARGVVDRLYADVGGGRP